MNEHRFAPRGPLALEQSAFGMVLVGGFKPPATVVRGNVAVVPVRGPLMHHVDPLCDSYDGVKERVAAAIAGGPRTVVLALDSPGGLVSGCFSIVREIRAMAKAAGVDLVAYVEGTACSAAYALACAASKIVVPEAGLVGHVGVMDAIVDAHRAEANQGIDVTLIGSGEHKLDGHPRAPMQLSALDETRARVASLAEVFFGLVAEARQLTVDEVRAIGARVMHGRQAIGAGLADEVATLDELLAQLATTTTSSPAAAGKETTTMTEDEKARAALKAVIDGDGDEKAKAKAKRALAALDGDDGPDKKDAPEKDEEEAKAAAEAAKAEAAKAAAKSGDEDTTAAKALAEVHSLRAELAKRDEDAERDRLIASRPDFSKEHVETLRKAPIALVREQVEKLPRVAFTPAAAAAGVQPTLGAGQGGGPAPHLPPEEKARLDAAMGLGASAYGVVVDGREQLFGAPIPKKA